MVGLRILVLWILPALCLSEAPKLSPEMEAKYMVHTYEKRGHRYMIEVDNDKTSETDPDNFIYKAIGVAMYNTGELSYSEFKIDQNEQTIIYPFSGAATSGNDAFDLIHTDFKNIERVKLADFLNNKDLCKEPIRNNENYAVLYLEHKRGDPKNTDGTIRQDKNVKRIGTYFRKLGLYKFVNDENELEQLAGVPDMLKSKVANTVIRATRLEVLCRVPHGYMTAK